MSPCLDDLVRDPARAGLLSAEERQALLAQVVALLFALGAPAGGDRLLTVEEAAHKLGCAAHTLYRNKRHPARVQNGRSIGPMALHLDPLTLLGTLYAFCLETRATAGNWTAGGTRSARGSRVCAGQ